MGLKTALGYDFATSAKFMRDSNLPDPFSTWKDARAYFYAKRAADTCIALLLIFCVMLARAGDREPDWVAACLGTGLIVMASELTCYYYGFLLTYGLMWERRKIPGVLATALSALTCVFPIVLGLERRPLHGDEPGQRDLRDPDHGMDRLCGRASEPYPGVRPSPPSRRRW